ncbi:PNG1 [Scenedesmus sp. PABB004]|nr:PNG1 [Scenedesmus sp. PABB004]
MEADRLLAAALQAEEDAAAAREAGRPPDEQARLVAELNAGVAKALSVEDASARAAALELMQLAELRAEAAATAALHARLGEPLRCGEGDLAVQGLAAWFKASFFTWVDQPPCEVCGGGTTHAGMAAPTPQEAAHGAGRVETYRCTVCSQVTRFPRYTHAVKLLSTRRGRCGEWAHTFLLLLRAADFEARHVSDCADHVWCEYWSDGLGRWVHVDACERSWDQPLLYEAGWGKRIAHAFAAGRHGVADVTRCAPAARGRGWDAAWRRHNRRRA